MHEARVGINPLHLPITSPDVLFDSDVFKMRAVPGLVSKSVFTTWPDVRFPHGIRHKRARCCADNVGSS